MSGEDPQWLSDTRGNMFNLRKTFEELDQDGRGKLDLEQFHRLLDRLETGHARAEAQELFKAIDYDARGLIDYAEVDDWWRNRRH